MDRYSESHDQIRVDKPGYSVRFWELCKNDIADGQSALVIAQMQHYPKNALSLGIQKFIDFVVGELEWVLPERPNVHNLQIDRR